MLCLFLLCFHFLLFSSVSLPIWDISWQTEETQLQKVIRNFQVNSFFFFFVRIFHVMEEFDSYIGWPFFFFLLRWIYIIYSNDSSLQFSEESILAILSNLQQGIKDFSICEDGNQKGLGLKDSVASPMAQYHPPFSLFRWKMNIKENKCFSNKPYCFKSRIYFSLTIRHLKKIS